MPGIYTTTRKTGNRVSVVRSIGGGGATVGEQFFLSHDLNPTLKRFTEFWSLIDVIQRHGYLRAALSVVGRAAVGTWWTLRRHREYGKSAREIHRKRLYAFYMSSKKQWTNIKDYQTFAYKLMIGAMYLKLVGQVAYQIVRDESGTPVGLDHLPGVIIPNVDASGAFRSPAFIQYPTKNPSNKVEFENPRDIVYIVNPDWRGSPMGGSDVEALTEYVLPMDIYLQVAAREYLRNRDKPEVVYELAPDISEQGFRDFVNEMSLRRSGPSNMGKNPVVVQGDFKVHELRPYPNALPYQDSRKLAREEELAVVGVSGSKLGIGEGGAGLRELRREFHETSMRPLFRLIELALYEQVHVREYGIDGWELVFNNPDFLTAVERATVDMRYHGMGATNPNEIRADSLGKEPRTDPQGSMYADQLKLTPQNSPGSPPEGRPVEPDDPSQIGEPTLDDQDPPRGDQHDDEPRSRLLRELRQWRTFSVNRYKPGKQLRAFETQYVDRQLYDLISGYISTATDKSEVARVFDEVIATIQETWRDG